MAVLTILVSILVVGTLVVCYALSKQKRFFTKAMASALCGIGTLGAINLFSTYTGVCIALNFCTALVSVIFSVPGVIMLLLLRLIVIVG